MRDATVLRYLCSTDPDKITRAVASLGTKIEIKQFIQIKNKVYLFYTLPDHQITIDNIDLDKVGVDNASK